LAEKVATDLVMPVAAGCWIVFIFGLKSFVRGNGRAAFIALFISFAIFLVANPVLSKAIGRSLEGRFPEVDLKTVEPFDTIVVLGGGTSSSPNNRSQFAAAGDRVGLAARMYFMKLTKKLVVTGDVVLGIEAEEAEDPSVQSKTLLLELGVPNENIVEITGINTKEEMAALKKQPELWEEKRLGLITSAFHMPRAIRLAKSLGLEPIPVAADFRSSHKIQSIRDWIPSAAGLGNNDLNFREFIAQLVGR
jgi:uncharacterized SAM-binding protein YcdF (DUF218 family)